MKQEKVYCASCKYFKIDRSYYLDSSFCRNMELMEDSPAAAKVANPNNYLKFNAKNNCQHYSPDTLPGEIKNLRMFFAKSTWAFELSLTICFIVFGFLLGLIF